MQFPDTVERWPIDRLRPYDRNARTHSDSQVAQIAASVIEFGFTNPILADGRPFAAVAAERGVDHAG